MMRSLAEHQWERYFDLVARLERLPVDERWSVLRAEVADPDVAELAALRLRSRPDFDRCRSGERIRNLVLAERIGSGGMGAVYRATQTFSDGIERAVAVKLIDPALLLHESTAAQRRFKKEIAALAQLEHRGIARLYDGGLYRCPEHGEESLYIAMELVQGRPLTEHVAAHRAELGTIGILRLFLRVCDAVEHAHRRGIVHRDLKPANVLVDGAGEPRVVDFGLAAIGANPFGDGTGPIGGTPAYMSPEQRRGARATPAMDVFALGVMLHELLGVEREPSAELAHLVATAMAVRAVDRYRSVAALMDALYGCIDILAMRQRGALRTRDDLLRKVQAFWIDGVLERSLRDGPPIELGLARHQGAIEHAWRSIVGARCEPRALPHGTRIADLFDASGEALLVLGAPGCGKTTLLLRLAAALLERARRDPAQRIPVVFHLSTWAAQRLPLAAWLVDELDQRYDLPPRAGRICLAEDRLVLLLDGLDEVAPEHRAGCVAAINAFRRQCRGARLAVCSRLADYEALSIRLRLTEAIAVEPLTHRQVDDYLERAGDSLAGLRAALAGDEPLRELLATPLLLGIAALAYRDRPALIAAGTADERRRLLFEAYAQAMFARRGAVAPYDPQTSLRWLGWLADALRRHHQSIFYLESMQPDWLSRPLDRWAAGAGSVSLCGLLVGLVVGIGSSADGDVAYRLPVSLLMGLAGGFAFGLQGWGDQIRPIAGLRWSWSSLRDALPAKLTLAIGVGPLLGGGVALVFDPAAGTALGAMAVLGFGYFSGLDRDALRRDPGQIATPNQGIRQSLRNALRGSAIGAPAGAVAGACIGGFASAVFCAAVAGLVMALTAGAHPCLQHLMLRLSLLRRGHAPWHYQRFLDFAVERILLRRVGGGYAFVHREMLEYLAEQHDARAREHRRGCEVRRADSTARER